MFIVQDVYSAAVLGSVFLVFSAAFGLLLVNVPAGEKLRNYRIGRRLLTAAYLLLASVGLVEVYTGRGFAPWQQVMVFTLIAASFQASFFTCSIVMLVDVSRLAVRRVVAQLVCISLFSVVLLFCLFLPFAAAWLHYLIYGAVVCYGLQLLGYVYLFRREYKRYCRQIDNFFADGEDKRLRWIITSFCMALTIGILALASSFFPENIYIAFTIGYTLFYILFAIKYINYGFTFYRIEPALEAENEEQISSSDLSAALNVWIGQKRFLHKDLTLESVAEELRTNRTYLSKHINHEMNHNFKSWIRELRIKEACRLMDENNEISLREVGELVGIPDRSSFHRQFTLQTGTTPGSYRKTTVK
ncbi:AraC-like DNA-binding protein [Parabacteroides sp. PF5-5]|uniref:helix-turn-helix domain-containing protein n=1 Tax=unclassified Parabacteroides TaxID=2649774 RepID=UPI00247560C4|nr:MULTISPECIES: AraC family transcriptional regulator [unclassified Parabacteroides]MDH6306950.1 AraC-like DNA-binding protein [Parabacteroides sp. PH5-39]MDH6317824.1 AraC-like DNA-binding protein [Parabacteroides sp. PF5-13]MDH6321555.1 AraC-like DNA-binding protein [Parabacteroides sp. PH5-13]MDH6325369.1 AraC-like DNA-binding protein [Parabacteroides sp. PH5-8]MDH6329040.1 AraC-like DNA-binding protein [Parabacteroides sp. PH5-41]